MHSLPLKRVATSVWVFATCLYVTHASHAFAAEFQQTLQLDNPCAVFTVLQPDGVTTRIEEGELIAFDLRGTVDSVVEPDDGLIKLLVSAHGNGIGQTSGIRYHFNGKAVFSSKTSVDINDPSFQLREQIRIDARIIGEGNAASDTTLAQKVQDNTALSFDVEVRIGQGQEDTFTSNFSITCAGSPWNNLMEAREAKTKLAVGRGFGDPWNKYTWSMADFGGGVVVGTKSAFYDGQGIADDNGSVGTCIDNDFYQVTSIHEAIACAELFGAPNSGTFPVLADARDAELWRYDQSKKTWTQLSDASVLNGSQGFRSMETHAGKLYVGSDLGAFITGVDLYDGGPYSWTFPGSQLLVSSNGKDFEPIRSCETDGPCNSASGVSNPYGILGPPGATGAVNTSIRAIASYDGKLYVGTFNAWGGQLWSYDDASDTWDFIHQFFVPDPNPFKKPAVAELQAFNGKLYIGLAGPAGNNYLYAFDGTSVSVVPNQAYLPLTNFGTLKLFASSKGILYVGNLDLTLGFTLQAFDGTTFTTITDNGFFNAANAYPWSMEEVNGRVFVGTFSLGSSSLLSKGMAELWYSDDDVAWQQVALPAGFGPSNYGVRSMVFANSVLYLGSASNMLSPDLTFFGQPTAFSPGTEVWSIRTSAIGPSRKTTK